jgi:Protein of unknown function (DUF998)
MLVTKPPANAARISMIGASAFIAIVAVLHGLRPDLDPSWRVISEYEIGPGGWLMQLAFVALAVGSTGLLFAVRPLLGGWLRVIGLFLLTVNAIGLIVAGVFVTDPVTVPREAWSTSGAIHGWGALFMIQSTPLLATVITWGLVRRGEASRTSRAVLWVLVLGIWLAFGAFVAAGGTRVDGSHGPGEWYGWPNRAFILAFSLWLIAAARTARARLAPRG